MSPRLLSIKQAASYCGVSPSLIKEYLRIGEVRRVRLPAARRAGKTLRRVLIDRQQLDRLIDRSVEEYDQL